MIILSVFFSASEKNGNLIGSQTKEQLTVQEKNKMKRKFISPNLHHTFKYMNWLFRTIAKHIRLIFRNYLSILFRIFHCNIQLSAVTIKLKVIEMLHLG